MIWQNFRSPEVRWIITARPPPDREDRLQDIAKLASVYELLPLTNYQRKTLIHNWLKEKHEAFEDELRGLSIDPLKVTPLLLTLAIGLFHKGNGHLPKSRGA